MRGSVSPCQAAYKARNKRQMKIRGLHEEDGKKKAERRTFEVRHRSFGISRLHSSLLCSFDRYLDGYPEGGLQRVVRLWVVIYPLLLLRSPIPPEI